MTDHIRRDKLRRSMAAVEALLAHGAEGYQVTEALNTLEDDLVALRDSELR